MHKRMLVAILLGLILSASVLADTVKIGLHVPLTGKENIKIK